MKKGLKSQPMSPEPASMMVVYVEGHDGKPVAAPCCISGCQYDASSSLSPAIRQQIEWVKTFIESARYELQPGTQQFGDQFPRRDVADRAIKILAALLSSSSPQGREI